MAKETLINNNDIEVNSDLVTVSTKTINSGLDTGNFDLEKTVFKMAFRSKVNKPLKIGTVSVSVADNNKFIKSPQFLQNQFTKKKNFGTLVPMLKKKVRDSDGNITSYLYNLIYTAKKQKNSTQRYRLHAKTTSIPVKTTGITRVICSGRYNIRPTGENRIITVYGSPNTNFVLSVNKITDYFDSTSQKEAENDRGILKHAILNTEEVSITNTSGSSKDPSVTVFGDGSQEDVFHGNTGPKGKYVYRHFFPSAIETTRYSINVKNINLSPKFNTDAWTLRTDRWDDWYTKELVQYANPKLTLRLTTTEGVGNISVDSNGDGAGETFNSGAPIDIVYNGVYGLKRPVTKQVKYTFNNLKGASTAFSIRAGVGAAVSFTNAYGETQTTSNTLGIPTFNRTNQSTITDGSGTVTENGSSWTNSVASKNGGTQVEITNIKGTLSTVSHANDTFTLTFSIHLNTWGTEDVTMSLAQQYIIARS